MNLPVSTDVPIDSTSSEDVKGSEDATLENQPPVACMIHLIGLKSLFCQATAENAARLYCSPCLGSPSHVTSHSLASHRWTTAVAAWIVALRNDFSNHHHSRRMASLIHRTKRRERTLCTTTQTDLQCEKPNTNRPRRRIFGPPCGIERSEREFIRRDRSDRIVRGDSDPSLGPARLLSPKKRRWRGTFPDSIRVSIAVSWHRLRVFSKRFYGLREQSRL